MDAQFVISAKSKPAIEADLIMIEFLNGESPRLIAFRNNRLVSDQIDVGGVSSIEIRWVAEVHCPECKAARRGPQRAIQLRRAPAFAAAVAG